MPLSEKPIDQELVGITPERIIREAWVRTSGMIRIAKCAPASVTTALNVASINATAALEEFYKQITIGEDE